MDLFSKICAGLSVGILAGVAAGGIKVLLRGKSRPAKNREAERRMVSAISALLKYITFLMLAVGLVWCVYFLVMGVAEPQQADYANNMSELIVSVLTVVSIIFAFVEFIRRKGVKE